MGVAERVRTSTLWNISLKRLLMCHAEPLLLVDDGKAQILELHILLDHPVGADDDVHQTPADVLRMISSCCLGVRKRESSSMRTGIALHAAQ